ncbi:hypothetical protein HGA91_02090 [candidate division WWE3 bacterium]|nr:hypothetical protein [candidate division WWE3 bacterium]
MTETIFKQTPSWFRQKISTDVSNSIKQSDSCLIVSIPGVGKTFLLQKIKQKLSSNSSIKPIFVDLNNLRELTIDGIHECIINEINLTLENTNISSIEQFVTWAAKQRKRYVIIFDRFEKALAHLPNLFFDTLRSMVVQSNRHVTMVISLNQPIESIRDIQDIDQFYTLVAPFTFYLEPFDEKEANYYIEYKSNARGLHLNSDEIDTVYEITGGHNRMIDAYIYQLTAIEHGSFKEKLTSAAHHETVIFQCQRILNVLTESQQKAIQRLVVGLHLTERDQLELKKLSQLGVINEKKKVFSSRLADFITENHPALYLDDVTGEVYKKGVRIDDIFTPNEYKFFRYMYEHHGRVIDRDEIAEAVWEVRKEQGVSDEAIDQLVSRLRDKVETDKYNPKHLITVRGRGFQLKLN